MRIRELNESKHLNELDISPFLNAGSAIKNSFKDITSPADQSAMNVFIKKFTNGASTNIKQAIDSGLVGKTSGQAPQSGQPAAPAAAKPGQPAAPAAAKPGQPAAPAARAKGQTQGAGAFGQMASQLSSTKSSTGGTTTQTPTGIRHTANPKNPNIKETIFNEANQQPISQYVLSFYKKFMQGVDPRALQAAMPQAELLAKEIESSYPNINEPLTKLAQLGWAVSHQEGEDKSDTTAQSSDQQTTTGSTPGSQPAQTNTVYAQVKELLPKLDKKGKQRILATLQKSLGSTV